MTLIKCKEEHIWHAKVVAVIIVELQPNKNDRPNLLDQRLS